VISLAASILLVVADEIGGTVRWTHHSGASAAPPLLVASAITAVSLAHPPRRRHALMRLMAALAFMAWGIAQLVPDPGVSAALDDVAILLFVADAGCAMISDARALLTARRKQAPAAQPAPGPARAGQPRRRLPPLPPSRAGVRSRRSRIPSELRAADRDRGRIPTARRARPLQAGQHLAVPHPVGVRGQAVAGGQLQPRRSRVTGQQRGRHSVAAQRGRQPQREQLRPRSSRVPRMRTILIRTRLPAQARRRRHSRSALHCRGDKPAGAASAMRPMSAPAQPLRCGELAGGEPDRDSAAG